MKKILVVEDDPVNGLVLMDFLNAHGYETSLSRTGTDGVAAFTKETPDLMIVDVLLPLKNGFEVCFDVKRTVKGREMPLLLMSAITKDATAQAYATEGVSAQGFIAKPFDLRDLLERVRALVGPS